MEAHTKINVAFLHGFGGNRDDFKELLSFFPPIIMPHFLTIAGHEQTPHPASIEEEVQRLCLELEKLPSLYLCGYSMGGRLATLISQRIKTKGLILLSSGMGEEAEQRNSRLKKDLEWAELLKKDPDLFFKKWYEQTLFQSLAKLPPEKKDVLRQSKNKHHFSHLAQALVALSPANHLDLRPLLSKQKKILYMAGALDKKYAELAMKLKNEFPHIQKEVIPEVGHILPLEAPQICAKKILTWLGQ